jgi:hypothetical protein
VLRLHRQGIVPSFPLKVGCWAMPPVVPQVWDMSALGAIDCRALARCAPERRWNRAANHPRDDSSHGAIQPLGMVTLADSQGGCDQDSKAVSDAVEASVWRMFLRLTLRALGAGPKARRVLNSRRWSPSDCPGTPCPHAEGCSYYSSMNGANRRRAPRGFGRAWAGQSTPPASLESVPRDDYHPSGCPPTAQTGVNVRLVEPRRVHEPPRRWKVLRGEAGFTGRPLSSWEV